MLADGRREEELALARAAEDGEAGSFSCGSWIGAVAAGTCERCANARPAKTGRKSAQGMEALRTTWKCMLTPGADASPESGTRTPDDSECTCVQGDDSGARIMAPPHTARVEQRTSFRARRTASAGLRRALRTQ